MSLSYLLFDFQRSRFLKQLVLSFSLANQSSVDEYLVVEGYPGIKSSTGTYKPGNKHDRRKHVTDHMTKVSSQCIMGSMGCQCDDKQ